MKIKHYTPVQKVLNAPRVICDHFLGQNHSHAHRVTVGTVIMLIGVLLANFHTPVFLVNIATELIGYVIHGIGAVPIVEGIITYQKTV